MSLIRRTPDILRSRKRSGFSLIIVLIVSMIGLAIIGATLQFTVMSSGGGRIVAAGNTKYNFLQDAVEEGKAALKAAMDVSDPDFKVPRHYSEEDVEKPLETIGNVDELLIKYKFDTALANGVVFARSLSRSDLGKLGITGNGAVLDVKIYDMQYAASADVTIPAGELKLLPPSMLLYGSSSGPPPDPNLDDPFKPKGDPKTPQATESVESGAGNAGVYLIRASLLIDGQNSPTILDTALIQSRKDPE